LILHKQLEEIRCNRRRSDRDSVRIRLARLWSALPERNPD
jgi:hypothetical protein